MGESKMLDVQVGLYDRAVLLCPECGFNATHVDIVEVTSAGGDRVTVTATGEDEWAKVSVRPTAARAETGRRHTVALYLECEECRTLSRLSLQQHKGATFAWWG